MADGELLQTAMLWILWVEDSYKLPTTDSQITHRHNLLVGRRLVDICGGDGLFRLSVGGGSLQSLCG